MSESRTAPILEQLKTFGRPFWAANVMEIFERLAYYGVRVVVPIYIASSEDPNGLHFDNAQKGFIFTVWALIQTLLPMFTGGFADKYGRKSTLFISIAIKVAGYLLMATQRSFWGFFIGCMVLAAGTAIFKPGQQGTLARGITKKNSSLGWGIFYQVVNIGGWIGPPLAGYLHRLSWKWVFIGCAVIVSLNMIVLLTYDDEAVADDDDESVQNANSAQKAMQERSAWGVLVYSVKTMFRPRLLSFILIMGGFWGMMMQLFDSLPNFIEEWVDSSDIVALFDLKEGLLAAQTSRGLQVPQEMMINLDATAILLLIIPLSFVTGRLSRLGALALGLFGASLGFLIAGTSATGFVCLLGIFVIALGEMTGAPKMWEYLAIIAPRGEEALYMGYTNVPVAIGWTAATYVAGYIYDRVADKANLALRYLGEKNLASPDTLAKIPRTQAMSELQKATHLDAAQATKLLWDAYHPYTFWFLFIGLGVASGVGILVYARFAERWAREKEAAGVGA